MMRTSMLLAATLLLSGPAMATTGAHWGYEGEGGPQHWAQLTPEYGACAGSNQSPVDLRGFVSAALPPIGFDYQPGGHKLVNNGHTVQVNYAAGSSITLDGRRFVLKQFHFHAPSENLVEGRSYPMEAHLVHADDEGHLAVVAVMIAEGEHNPVLDAAWAQMPENAGDQRTLAAPLTAEGILPADRGYYRFSGSLTTPPCTEGVRWLVMKAPVSASREQIERFAHVLHHPNNRPVQPLNARLVLE